MKIFNRIIIDSAIIITALVLFTGWRALMPPRMPVYLLPSDLGLPYGDIAMQTEDGVELKGWLAYSEKSGGIIICLHGYPANKSDILPAVSFLYPDFSLLFLDFRAHGESAGRITHFGLKEFLDVKAALDFVKQDERLKEKRAGLWGYSFGGAVSILASGRYKEIEAVVTDSAFANFPEMVTYYYKNTGPLRHIFSFMARLLGRVVLKGDFIQNSPEYAVGKINAPIMIIHSQEDGFIPYSHAERLFEKAPEPKKLWTAGGPHTGIDRAFTEEYRNQVSGFFSEHLLKRGITQ